MFKITVYYNDIKFSAFGDNALEMRKMVKGSLDSKEPLVLKSEDESGFIVPYNALITSVIEITKVEDRRRV